MTSTEKIKHHRPLYAVALLSKGFIRCGFLVCDVHHLGFVSYVCANTRLPILSEVQSHSPEWSKRGCKSNSVTTPLR